MSHERRHSPSQPSVAVTGRSRARQVCVLGSADPGSAAYELAGAVGQLLARLGITLVSGCGSPATRLAAERALAAGGLVVSIVTSDDIDLDDALARIRQVAGELRAEVASEVNRRRVPELVFRIGRRDDLASEQTAR